MSDLSDGPAIQRKTLESSVLSVDTSLPPPFTGCEASSRGALEAAKLPRDEWGPQQRLLQSSMAEFPKLQEEALRSATQLSETCKTVCQWQVLTDLSKNHVQPILAKLTAAADSYERISNRATDLLQQANAKFPLNAPRFLPGTPLPMPLSPSDLPSDVMRQIGERSDFMNSLCLQLSIGLRAVATLQQETRPSATIDDLTRLQNNAIDLKTRSTTLHRDLAATPLRLVQWTTLPMPESSPPPKPQ